MQREGLKKELKQFNLRIQKEGYKRFLKKRREGFQFEKERDHS